MKQLCVCVCVKAQGISICSAREKKVQLPSSERAGRNEMVHQWCVLPSLATSFITCMHLYQGLHSVYFRIRCTYAEPLKGHGSLPSKSGCANSSHILCANSSLLATVLCEGGVQPDVSDESSAKSTIMITRFYSWSIEGRERERGGGEREVPYRPPNDGRQPLPPLTRASNAALAHA